MKFAARALWAYGLVALMAGFGPAAELPAQQPATEEGRSRFATIDLFVDSGSTPLAAYQVEFTATNAPVKIIGIEGGKSAAFSEPPAYDPKAMQGDRAILARFVVSPKSALPSGKVLVAAVHVQILGTKPPVFEVTLHAAADSYGRRIVARATLEERKTHDP